MLLFAYAPALVPFRWMALSGDSADIEKIDDLVLKLFPPHNRIVTNWIGLCP